MSNLSPSQFGDHLTFKYHPADPNHGNLKPMADPRLGSEYNLHRVTAHLGDAEIGHVEWEGGERGAVEMVKVHHDHQEKGIGTRLMQEAVTRGANVKDAIPISHGGQALMRKFTS